jgi:hypothetical protein
MACGALSSPSSSACSARTVRRALGILAITRRGSCLQVLAGQRVARTVSVAVRAIGRLGTCGHGHVADGVVAAALIQWCLRWDDTRTNRDLRNWRMA